MATNNKELAKLVLNAMGGLENVIEVENCVTRLRFVTRDPKKINQKKLENTEGVLGVIESAGTFQVIMGPRVDEVHKELAKLIPTSGSSTKGETKMQKEEIESQDEPKKSLLDRFLATFSAIFLPYIPLFATFGIIAGIIQLLVQYKLLNSESPTYLIFNSMAYAVIYFFPILLGFTAAKQFGANPYVGAVIGGALIHPDLAKILTNGAQFSFLGLTIKGMTFSSNAFPIILSMYVLAKVEAFLKKILPEVLQFILVPLLSLVIVTSLTILVVGPVGNFISNLLLQGYEAVLSWGLVPFGVVMGGFYIFAVLFGLHWVLIPVQINYWVANGIDYSFPAITCAMYGLMGIALASAILSKDEKQKNIAGASAFSLFLAGISEPALYGVIMKNKRYFLALCLSGAIGGLICGLFGVYSKNIAFAGLLTFPAYASSPTVVAYVLAIVTSAVVGFGLAYVFHKSIVREENMK